MQSIENLFAWETLSKMSVDLGISDHHVFEHRMSMILYKRANLLRYVVKGIP